MDMVWDLVADSNVNPDLIDIILDDDLYAFQNIILADPSFDTLKRYFIGGHEDSDSDDDSDDDNDRFKIVTSVNTFEFASIVEACGILEWLVSVSEPNVFHHHWRKDAEENVKQSPNVVRAIILGKMRNSSLVSLFSGKNAIIDLIFCPNIRIMQCYFDCGLQIGIDISHVELWYYFFLSIQHRIYQTENVHYQQLKYLLSKGLQLNTQLPFYVKDEMNYDMDPSQRLVIYDSNEWELQRSSKTLVNKFISTKQGGMQTAFEIFYQIFIYTHYFYHESHWDPNIVKSRQSDYDRYNELFYTILQYATTMPVNTYFSYDFIREHSDLERIDDTRWNRWKVSVNTLDIYSEEGIESEEDYLFELEKMVQYGFHAILRQHLELNYEYQFIQEIDWSHLLRKAIDVAHSYQTVQVLIDFGADVLCYTGEYPVLYSKDTKSRDKKLYHDSHSTFNREMTKILIDCLARRHDNYLSTMVSDVRRYLKNFIS
jgi:hypothetical protein